LILSVCPEIKVSQYILLYAVNKMEEGLPAAACRSSRQTTLWCCHWKQDGAEREGKKDSQELFR